MKGATGQHSPTHSEQSDTDNGERAGLNRRGGGQVNEDQVKHMRLMEKDGKSGAEENTNTQHTYKMRQEVNKQTLKP